MMPLPIAEEIDVRFPSWCVWVEGFFATIWEDGSIELCSDGDVRVPLKVWKKFGLKADRFMVAREREKWLLTS